jgi:hypothetical protein
MPSIITDIENFVLSIKEKYDINTKYNIVITSIETVEVIKNPNQCIALVSNIVNGKKIDSYQCTRNKKYGMFCGLHYNRKSDFVPIETFVQTNKKHIHLNL